MWPVSWAGIDDTHSRKNTATCPRGLSSFEIYAFSRTVRNVKVNVKLLSRVRLFVTPWTVAHQAPPSMGFSRQEYWSGLPFPSPGDLPNSGIEPRSPSMQADTLTSEPILVNSNICYCEIVINTQTWSVGFHQPAATFIISRRLYNVTVKPDTLFPKHALHTSSSLYLCSSFVFLEYPYHSLCR